MKKTLKIISLLFISVICSFGITLSANAMTDEEREMFDTLGITYSVDADGNFEAFTVDENSPKLDETIRLKFMEKYKNVTRVGDFNVVTGMDTIINRPIVSIRSTDGSISCSAVEAVTIYQNPDKSYLTIDYKDYISGEVYEEPFMVSKGTTELSEYDLTTFETRVRNDKGELVMMGKSDGRNYYDYEDGELVSRQDHATYTIYDGMDKPVMQGIRHDAEEIWGEPYYVNYDIAKSVQKIVDDNNGHLFDITKNNDGTKSISYGIPDIAQLICDSNYAQMTGMRLEVYQKKVRKFLGPDESTTCVSLSTLAAISGKDSWEFWSNPVEPEPEAIPESISATEISQELNRLINEYRIENGLEALDNSDSLLQQVADIRSKEITYYQDCAHSRPMTGSFAAFDVGENTAKFGTLIKPRFDTSAEIALEIFNAWKKSPGHKENMLNAKYLKGACSVSLVKHGNGHGILFYASNNFADFDYENEVSDEVRATIETGPQTKDNVEALADYYEKKNKRIEQLKAQIEANRVPYEGDLAYKDEEPLQEAPAPVENTGSGIMITEEEFNVHTCFNHYDFSKAQRVSDDYTESVLTALEVKAVDFNMSESDTYNPPSIGRSIPIRLGTDVETAAGILAWDIQSIAMTGTLTSDVYYISAIFKVDNGYVFVIDLNR